MRIDVSGLPHADTPHRYAGTTCGHIAEQMMALHPRADEATEDEVAALVAGLASGDGANLVEYMVGGRIGGQLGAPGTWVGVATGPGTQLLRNLSPFVDQLIDTRDPVEDPTVLERVRIELERLADEHAATTGERIAVPRLLRRTADAFGTGHDVIHHEAPGGEDSFWGSFSHVPLPARHSPAVTESLARGFAQIRLHHLNWDHVEKAIAGNASRARKRFERLGASTGATRLFSVEEAPGGGISSVATVTELDVLGDDLRPRTVLLQLRNPPRVDKGEIDGWKVHGRDQKRRAKILDGRDPMDAITVCPVLYRTIASLRPGQRRLLSDCLRLTAGEIRLGTEDGQMEDVMRGVGIRDGHITGTLAMPRGTWRGRTLLVPDTVLPHAVLTALEGRPFAAVMEEPRLEGLVIAKAACDSKNRLNVTMAPIPGVPLRDALAACAA